MRLSFKSLSVAILVAVSATVSRADLADGLVAYYPLDGDTSDAVGNSHGVGKSWLPGGKENDPAALAAHPTTDLSYAAGKHGLAVDLNGVDQYIETPLANENIFDFGAPDAFTGFTVSAWFRVDGFTKGWQALIAKGEQGQWRIHRQAENPNFGPVGGVTTPNNDIGENSTPVNDGRLHHVVLVSDPDGQVAYYLDGVLIDAGDSPPVLEDNVMPMMIGQNPDTDNRTWNGLIDDVAFWNRALSEDEIVRLATSGMPVGLLATGNLRAGAPGMAGQYWNTPPKSTVTSGLPMHRPGGTRGEEDNANAGWVDANILSTPRDGIFVATQASYQGGDDLTPVVDWLQADGPSFVGEEGNMDDGVMRFTGYVVADAAGSKSFSTNSDDGSVIYVGNTKVAEHDNGHGRADPPADYQSGDFEFPDAGYYPIDIRYFNGDWTDDAGNHGGANLEVGGDGFAEVVTDVFNPYARSYQVNYTPQAPTIDGAVNADEWGSAAYPTGGFSALRVGPVAAGEDVRFQAVWDDDALYLLVLSDYGNWNGPTEGAINFGADNINIYFDPNNDGGPINGSADAYQVAFNQGMGSSSSPSLQAFVEAHIGSAFGNQGNWDGSGVEFSQTNTENGGVLEVKIPFSTLTGKTDTSDSLLHPDAPANGKTWGFNLGRISSDSTAENFLPIWNYHDDAAFSPDRRGVIQFAGKPADGALLVDFGNTGPNANGTADGWIGVSNLVQDTPQALGDTGATITAMEDGFNPNNPAGPGAAAMIAGVQVPAAVLDDYLFKIADAAGTSAKMRIDGLAAGEWDITVFEGRTTDSGQQGKIWVGTEPADPNTGDFAAGKSGTVRVSVAQGQSVFYRHLEDGSGGISGMILQPAGGTTGPEAELIACWDFQDENATATTVDAVGGIDGTLVGDASLSAHGLGASGQAGDVALDLGSGAGSFQVDGAFLNDILADDSVTVMFWQKLRNVTSQTTFKMRSPSSSGGERGWSVHTPWSDQTIYYDTAGCCDGATQRTNKNNAGFSWTEWHHFAFVKDGENKQIWIDGELWHEAVNTAPLPSDITELLIGSALLDNGTPTESVDGWLDEFRIFRGVPNIAEWTEFKDIADPPVTNIEDYNNSFDFADGTTDLGDGSSISSNDGTASVQNGVLRLTQSGVNGTAAAYVLPPGFDGTSGWTMTFNFAVEHTGDNTPADGFSVNYGDIPGPDNFGNPAEEGYGDAVPHVSYQFDTWLWNDGAGQDAGVGIEVTGQEIALHKAFDDNANFKPNERVEGTALIAWDPAKGASFITNGLRVNADFINVATPGFTADPAFGFSILARTGGHNETVEIDNVVLRKGLHLPDTGPEPIPDGALKVHYDFEEGAGDTVINLAGGGLSEVANSTDGWVAGEQGTNGWTYGYRNVAADGPVDYDPAADFIAFPDTWANENGTWDEPNVDGDNVPWTTLAQTSGHPNGDNNGEIHWAIRRWTSDFTGQASVTYSGQKENNGCGNGTTVALHVNGARVDELLVENNQDAATSTVSLDVAEGDVIDVILSPLGNDGTNTDGCDGTLFSMNVSAASGAQNGSLVTTNDAAWQASVDALSPGGPGYLFFDSANGADATYVRTGFTPEELGIKNASYTMMARVRQDALGDGDNADAMVFGQVDGNVLHNGARGEQLYQGHWGNDIGGGSVELGTWRHITWVYDGAEAGTLAIYVNGEEVATGEFGGLSASDAEILIGTTRLDQNRDFIGCLDDVRIYSAALSPAQIKDIAFSFSAPTGGTFLARHIGAATGTQFDSMEKFRAALDDPALRSFDVTGAPKAINFQDNGNDGFVGGGVAFPAYVGQGGDHNDFGLHVVGKFYVSESGPRTFDGVSDDGNLYFINGVHVGGDPGLHGNNDAFGTLDLAAGLHTVEAFFFERGGGASFELLMAQQVGTFASRGEANFQPLQAALVDKDGDGMDDNVERVVFGDLARDGTGDFDGDRLNDATEFLLGTDMLRRDSDGDGLWDGAEVIAHLTNPLSGDSDGDGLNDRAEVEDFRSDPNDEDTDNDGRTDGDEVANGPSTVVYNFDTDPGLEIISNAEASTEIRDTGGNPGGYLSLTDAENGARAAIIFPATDTRIAGFNFTVDARIGGGTDRPADGMSINLVRPEDPLLQDPRGEGYSASPGGEANLPEEGSTTGLGIGFDAWDSGNGDVVGFSVKLDGELIAEVPAGTLNGSLTDPSSLQTGPNTDGINGLGWAPFRVSLNPNGLLNIFWKGTNVVSDLQTGWEPSPGQLVFGARTGGANQAHHFDNLSLTIIPEGSLSPTIFNPGGAPVLVHYDFELDGAAAAYVQDFDAAADGSADLGDGSLVFSNTDSAAVTGGALQLTLDGVGGQSAYWKTPALSGLAGGFDASFDVSLFRGEGGNPPADGFSFNLGNIADAAEAGEEGFGSGLAVEFDTWNNDGEGAANGIGIDISVDGADVATNREEAGADPRNNAFFSFDGQFRPVNISWRPAGGAQPLDIIFVSFHETDAASADAATVGFTDAPDKGYTDLLTAAGHNVTRWLTRDDPSADDLAALNAADLIVISRSVSSGNYSEEAEFWNTTVTTPVINLGGYTYRSSRLNWTDGTTMVDSTAPVTLVASDAGHPIFAGADLSQPYATFIDGQRGISFNMNTVVGGTVLAAAADDGGAVANGPAIIEFETGATVNNGNVLAGPRLGFLTGSREAEGVTSQSSGLFDLTAVGETLFLNAVNYITGNGGGGASGGLLDVTYGDLVIADDLPVNWAPQNGDRVAFGARTGGATETLLLDNFVIAGTSAGGGGTTVPNLGTAGDGTLVAPEGVELGDLVTAGVLELSGTETYIDTNNSSDALGVNGSNASYTMLARIRPSRVAGDNMLFGQPGDNLLLHNGIRNGSWHFGHWGNDLTAGTASVDTWYDVAWRYGGGVQTIIVDGKVVASGPRGGLNNPQNILVGLTRLGEDRAFQGKIDDVKIIGGSLSVKAIADLQGAGEPAAPELLVHYEFENGITTTVRNLGNKGAPNGHLNSTDVIGAYPTGVRSPSLGGEGVMFFNSAGNANATYIDTGLTAAKAKVNGANAYTMMAWALPTSARGGDQMIFGQPGGNALHNGIRDQRLHIGHWGNDLNAGAARVSFGQWQHLAFSYDTDGNQTIYVNGQQVAQENHGPLNNPDQNILIGTTVLNDDRDYEGYLDDVRIYCGSLSAQEIAQVAGLGDSDGDGLPDWFERANFGSLALDGSGDPDGDGINNADELRLGLNPNVSDSQFADADGDGWTKGDEDAFGTNDNDASSVPQIFVGGGEWEVRVVQSDGVQLTNLAAADALLNGTTPALADETTFHEFINFGDGANGLFDADTQWSIEADGDKEDFVMHAKGIIHVAHGGEFRLNLRTDDGGRVLVNGENVWNDDSLHGDRDGIFPVTLPPGRHMVEVTMFERGGGDNAELTGAIVTENSLNGLGGSSFQLVPAGTEDPRNVPPGLLGYWNFNDAAGDPLDLVNGVPAVLTGGAAYGEGASGAGDGAIDFGTTDGGQTLVVDPSILAPISATNKLTVSFFQKLHNIANSSSFWADAATAGDRAFQGHVPWSNGQVYFDTAGCCDGGTQRINGPVDTPVGQWQHFAFVKDGDTKSVYVDGVLAFTGQNTAPIPAGFLNFNIGSANGGASSLQGMIDEFSVWSVALSPERIAELASGEPAFEPGGLQPLLEMGPITSAGDIDTSGNIVYAVNARGPGGATIGDAVFTHDADTPGLSFVAQNEILSWAPLTEFGDTAEDNALESILNSIRWSAAADEPTGVTYDFVVTPGDYKVTLLFAEKCCDRGFDISVNGSLVADDFSPRPIQTAAGGDAAAGAFVAYSFTQTGPLLSVNLDGTNTTFADKNAIIMGLIVERLESAAGFPGLLGYWRFDEGSGDVANDSSGNGNDGAIAASADAWVSDAGRGSVYQSGGGSFVDFGGAMPALTLDSDFTWSFWVNPAETDNNNIVFGNRYGPDGNDFAPREFIKFTPRVFEWHVDAGGQNVPGDNTMFEVGAWTHNLVVKDGSTLTYYRNGVEVASSEITASPVNAQPLYLGGQLGNAGTVVENFAGLFDEVAIFDRALSAEEAAEVFQRGEAGVGLNDPFEGGGGNGALDIVFVSFHASDAPSQAAADAGYTDAPDKPYTDLLTAAGHNVTRWQTRDDPSNDDLAALNSADLIIISRSVSSGNYSEEAEFWNTMVTAPVINLGGYTWRNSRLNWTDGGTMVDSTAPVTLVAAEPTHPIFAGADLGQPYALLLDGQRGVSFNMNGVVGGTVLASASDDGTGVANGPAIIEFASGATVNNGNVLAGPRLGFLTGSREGAGVTSETAGLYDLTATGETLFLNAVNYITGNGAAPQVRSVKELVDRDRDGMADIHELIAGTNPEDNRDYFAIRNIAFEDGDLLIEFDARADRAYEIEHSATMTPGSWQVIGSQNAADEASPAAFRLPADQVTSSGFYRARVVQD